VKGEISFISHFSSFTYHLFRFVFRLNETGPVFTQRAGEKYPSADFAAWSFRGPRRKILE